VVFLCALPLVVAAALVLQRSAKRNKNVHAIDGEEVVEGVPAAGVEMTTAAAARKDEESSSVCARDIDYCDADGGAHVNAMAIGFSFTLW